MKVFLEKLKRHIADNPPNYGDADSVLGLLYECFNENNPYDNEQIKADFEMLYRRMNGMLLREMDRIVYPVCRLCRDHEHWHQTRQRFYELLTLESLFFN